MLRLLCFVSVVLSVRSALAPFIKACPKSDTACIKASAQATIPVFASGVPSLGIKPLDPLHLDLIKGDQGGLHLTFTDNDVIGLKGCSVDGAKQDLSKGKQSVTIRCTVTLTGDYKLSGQLLVLPIQGNGKYTIKIQDIVIKAFSDMETVQGADGKPHWQINNWRHTYHVKTGTQFDFRNLFNGNQVLASPVQQFVNDNWKDVMQEIAPPIVRSIVEAVVDDVKALYKAVPAEELFIE